jgi:hypothetical protein
VLALLEDHVTTIALAAGDMLLRGVRVLSRFLAARPDIESNRGRSDLATAGRQVLTGGQAVIEHTTAPDAQEWEQAGEEDKVVAAPRRSSRKASCLEFAHLQRVSVN